MMFPKPLISKIGYLDEDIPLYFEDIDFCKRIIQAGLKIRYLSDISVEHMGNQSSRALTVRSRMNLYVMELCQANYLFFRKYHSKFYAEFYRVLVFFGAIFRILIISAGCLVLKLIGRKTTEFSTTTLMKYAYFLKWSVVPKIVPLPGES